MSELTFDFDKLDREKLADRLTKAVTTFYPFADGAYVLSLNAKYGSGKTTFLQMWKSKLTSAGYTVIYIDAWKTDFDEDPIIPITSHIIESIKKETKTKKARTAQHSLIATAALSSNQIIKQATSIDIHETINTVQNELEQNDIIKIGEALYKQYNFKLKAYENIRIELSKYIDNLKNKPLIIFVDELDRARPDYSVKFLEAIKHIFSLEKICFVLAVDEIQLENSVKQLYGNIDFKNYYARFVTRQVNLAFSTSDITTDYVVAVYDEFRGKAESASLPMCISGKEEQQLKAAMQAVCLQLKLTPRLVRQAINSLFHIITVQKQTNPYRIEAIFFLICLKLQSTEEIYVSVAKGNILAREALDYIRNLNQSSSDEVFKSVLEIVYTFLIKTNNKDHINTILQQVWNHHSFDFTNELARKARGYGSIQNESAFVEIYKLLEEWRTFLNQFNIPTTSPLHIPPPPGMTLPMRVSLRHYLLQFALFAFVFGAVVPFFALYEGQVAHAQTASLEALYGEKIFICTERGFEWVKVADLPQRQHSPKSKTGHFDCALCFMGAKGAKHSQLAPMELALAANPAQALRLHFAVPVARVDGRFAVTPSIPRAPPLLG